MSSNTIFFACGGTGGHVYPMLAVAAALQQLRPSTRIVFVGTSRGMETEMVPDAGFDLELLDVRPLRGGGVSGALRGVARAAMAISESRALLRHYRPSVVFSIGGYAAGPVSLAARTLGIPVALMEPNSVVGLANRLSAPFVQRAYTNYSAAEAQFSSAGVRRTGVAIRDGFECRSYEGPGGTISVLVLGGSQGALSLNQTLPEAFADAVTPLRVVHQTGEAHVDEVRERYRKLGGAQTVDVVPFIRDMPAHIGAADLVISRAGASAVAEICGIGRASMLLPYPFAAGDHQRLNALALEATGGCVCIPAERCSRDEIRTTIDELCSDPTRLREMATAAAVLGKPNAAHEVAADLIGLAGWDKLSTPGRGAGGRSLEQEA